MSSAGVPGARASTASAGALNSRDVLDEISDAWFHARDVRYLPARVLNRHSHSTASLWVLLEGRFTERVGLEINSPAAFELMTRAPQTAHENQLHATGARLLVVDLDPDKRRVQQALLGGTLAPMRSRALATQLVLAFQGARSSRRLRVREALTQALRTLASSRRPPISSWLERAREILAERLCDPPTLVELAERLGVHPVYLAQAFRAGWGRTPGAFMREHRVFRAVGLIHAGVSLADAASAAGFADQSHMTRAIRRDRAASPGSLRRQMFAGRP